MASSQMAPLTRNVMTPVKQTTAAPVKESPGNWRHPRLAEITQRRSKTVFSEKNARQIAYNIGALATIVFLRSFFRPRLPARLLGADVKHMEGWVFFALAILPLFNIVRAILPLFRSEDDLADIPLTPAQRQLLGLPPSTGPPTPGSAYSTPPRYARTPSHSGSPSSLRSYTNSPTPNLGSPAPMNNSSMAKSPLFQKAAGGAMGDGRRSSFGSQGSLGASTFGASTATSLFGGEGPATPTPMAGKRSSVSLNNKWLYEKGRRSSGNGWMN
ncbi:nuclear pore complex component-domain-containing protein [Podospora conica]|nr:nuclear pore complex component-domain-containing protein [Schizothecium conicum]